MSEHDTESRYFGYGTGNHSLTYTDVGTILLASSPTLAIKITPNKNMKCKSMASTINTDAEIINTTNMVAGTQYTFNSNGDYLTYLFDLS